MSIAGQGSTKITYFASMTDLYVHTWAEGEAYGGREKGKALGTEVLVHPIPPQPGPVRLPWQRACKQDSFCALGAEVGKRKRGKEEKH